MSPSDLDIALTQEQLATTELIARAEAIRREAAEVLADTQELVSRSQELRLHCRELRRQDEL
jgi:hypothetical protein